MANILKNLSKFYGITSFYIDKMGIKHFTNDNLRKTFLKSQGIKNFKETSLQKVLKNLENFPYLNGFENVYSFFDNEKIEIPFFIEKNHIEKKVVFTFINENGLKKEIIKKLDKKLITQTKKIDGKIYYKLLIPFHKKFEPDYYNVIAQIDEKIFQTFLIIAPKSSYLPSVIQAKKKILGLSVQLYAIKSKHNMGIGDFSDLKTFITLAHKYGCDFVGINPLGVMTSNPSSDVSPYRTLSREYINYIYLDLQEIDDFKNSKDIQKYIKTPEYKKSLLKLKNAKTIDYKSIFNFKLKLLNLIYKHFKE